MTPLQNYSLIPFCPKKDSKKYQMKWTKTYSKLMIGTEIAFNSLVSRNGNSPFNGFKKKCLENLLDLFCSIDHAFIPTNFKVRSIVSLTDKTLLF